MNRPASPEAVLFEDPSARSEARSQENSAHAGMQRTMRVRRSSRCGKPAPRSSATSMCFAGSTTTNGRMKRWDKQRPPDTSRCCRARIRRG